MKTNSTISSEILDFIPYPESRIPDNRLADNINAEKFTDILLGIGDLKIVSSEVAFEQLRTIEAIDDPELKGMVMAGIGGVQTYIGNYVKASCAFHRALELARSHEAVAFEYSELSNLLRKLGHRDSAVTILDESLENCTNERLVWQLKWQRAFCYKYTHPELALKMLTEVADHYHNRNDLLNLARMKRHIGNIHDHLQDYDIEDSCYNKAMEIAVQLDAPHLQYEILNDRGWMWCQQGKYEKARSLFLGLLKKDLWPYEMALALQNLGVLEYSRERFRDAIHFHSQSLQLTTQYEMWEMVIEDYYKLGLCHDKLGLTGLANHFFSLGYQLVMEEAKLGLPMMDYRKKVVDSYVESLNKTREEERIEVARELHDELGQIFAALKMDWISIRKRLSEGDNQLTGRFDKSVGTIDSGIVAVRRIAKHLRVPLLEEAGLAATIEWQVKDFQERFGVECSISVDPEVDSLDSDRSIAVFRVVQEALNNVARHAKASNVKIQIKRTDGFLRLQITDNGKGIAEQEIAKSDSFGIIGMKERVRSFGGELTVRGENGKGTSVTATIPV